MAIFSSSRLFSSLLYRLLISALLIPVVYAQSGAPVRIDDASADIAYRPSPQSTAPERWIAFSPSNNVCPPGLDPCFTSSINPQRLSGGTWHQARGLASATYTFTGTGVAVHLAFNNAQGAVLDLSFFVDGRETKHTKVGNGVNDENGWIYDYVPFNEQSLSNGQHTLVISQSSGTSVVLIDYIEVTGGASPSASSSAAVSPTSASSATMASVVTSAPAPGTTDKATPVISTVFITSGSTTSAAISTIIPSPTSGTSSTSLSDPEASRSRPFPLVPVLVACGGVVAAALAIMALVLCLRKRKSHKHHKSLGTSSFANESGSPHPMSQPVYVPVPVSSYSNSPLQPSISPMPTAYVQPGNQFYANEMATRTQTSLVAHIDRMMASTNDNIIATSIAHTAPRNGLSPRPAHKYSPSMASSADLPTTARPLSSSTISLIPPAQDLQAVHGTPPPQMPQGLFVPKSVVPSITGGTQSQAGGSQSNRHSIGNSSECAQVRVEEGVLYMHDVPIYKPEYHPKYF